MSANIPCISRDNRRARSVGIVEKTQSVNARTSSFGWVQSVPGLLTCLHRDGHHRWNGWHFYPASPFSRGHAILLHIYITIHPRIMPESRNRRSIASPELRDYKHFVEERILFHFKVCIYSVIHYIYGEILILITFHFSKQKWPVPMDRRIFDWSTSALSCRNR